MTAAGNLMARPAGRIPGPKGKWLIGDVLEFEKDPIGWLERTKRDYGDAVRLDPDTVVMHHPQAVHRLLSWTNGAVILDNALLDERASQRDLLARLPEWMAVRRDTLRSLHRNLIEAHLSRITGALRSGLAAHAGHEVDVFQVAQRLCGQAVADFCLGADGPTTEVVDAVEALFWVSLELTEKREARRRFSRRPTMRRAIGVNEQLLVLLTERVRLRRAESRPSMPRDLLDVLLLNAESAPDRHLAAVLRITMVASHGIPGAALAWAFLRLKEHGEVSRAVAQEANAAGPEHDGMPTDRMPYTTAVVKEVLRLHPPAWLMDRKAIETIELDGYLIAPGTKIAVAPLLIHRDPRWWTDPERFDPQRWLDSEPPHGPHAYLPFGSGPRYCVGGHLGMVQLVLLVSEMAARYELELPPLARVPVRCKSLLLPEGLRGRWRLRDA